MDEDESPMTVWGCWNCKYIAYEDESFERVCNACQTKTEMRLEDEQKKYWWCCRCNRVTVIND